VEFINNPARDPDAADPPSAKILDPEPAGPRNQGRPGKQDRMELIGIYLNDHLAGATLGTALAHRVARGPNQVADQATLQRLAGEINADRRALLEIMALLGVPVRHYKTGAAWLGERVGRLKPNGRLRARSPVSDLEELELLKAGIEGKRAGWRTLRALADRDPRLNAGWLDELLARARAQADQVEDFRIRAAAQLVEAETEPAPEVTS
jgi:hypothetical protein